MYDTIRNTILGQQIRDRFKRSNYGDVELLHAQKRFVTAVLNDSSTRLYTP